jgi:hypothetical protein
VVADHIGRDRTVRMKTAADEAAASERGHPGFKGSARKICVVALSSQESSGVAAVVE